MVYRHALRIDGNPKEVAPVWGQQMQDSQRRHIRGWANPALALANHGDVKIALPLARDRLVVLKKSEAASMQGRVLWTLPRALNALLWLNDFSSECYRELGCCSHNGMQRASGAPSGRLRGAKSVFANPAT